MLKFVSFMYTYMNFVRPPLSDMMNQSRAGSYYDMDWVDNWIQLLEMQSFEKIANLICLISFLRFLSKFTWYWLNRLASVLKIVQICSEVCCLNLTQRNILALLVKKSLALPGVTLIKGSIPEVSIFPDVLILDRKGIFLWFLGEF